MLAGEVGSSSFVRAEAHEAGEEVAAHELWGRICARLRREVGEAAYRSWLQPLIVHEVRNGEVQMAVPTRFMRDWIASHYVDRIRTLWSGEYPALRALDIVVVPNQPPAPKPQPEPRLRDEARPAAAAAVARTVAVERAPASILAAGLEDRVFELDADYGLTAGLERRFTFDSFVVGPPNELAHAAARRVAEADNVAFNPLFLYGGVGLGKTHLMHAIAWGIRRRNPNRKVVYLSAEKFMVQFVSAIRSNDQMAFKQRFRSVDVLMIDDIQYLCGRGENTREEFFHTFNDLVDQNRQIVISADKSPADLDLEDRLRSRLGWGLVADIHPTTYELRLSILMAKAEAMSTPIPPKVVEFLAHRITSNVRELEGALNRIVAHAELVGRAITLEHTQDVLRDLLRANDRRITIEDIQRRTAAQFNVKVSDMHSPRRTRAVVRPRQVAMFLAKELTQSSLPEIGRKFGGRDHTTVLHAVRTIQELIDTDPALAEDVDLLRRAFEGG